MDRSVDIVIERDVPVVMRDGVTLRANVYRPADGGPFPVIMERTPYGKDAPRPSAAIDAVRAAGQGVAVVVQDVRGQAGSEGGSFYMFRDEFADGFDSVEWAAAQPFCNGHVGLYGTSYGANTSWQAAIADPPALGAIAPTQAPIDYVEGWPWLTRDGILKWGLTLNWTLAAIVESQIRRHSARRRARRAHGGVRRAARRSRRAVRDDAAAQGRRGAAGGHRAGDATEATRRCRSSVASSNATSRTQWRGGVGHDRAHTRVRVPAFITASWYDVILGHDLEHYARMQRDARHARGARAARGC